MGAGVPAEREYKNSDHPEPDLVSTSVGNAQRRINQAAYVGRLYLLCKQQGFMASTAFYDCPSGVGFLFVAEGAITHGKIDDGATE